MSGLHTMVQVKLQHGAQMPSQAHPGEDAGWDLHVLEPTRCPAGEYRDVRSGVRIALNLGWYCRIVGRSSAFRKKGVMVLEGIIDAGFRGELFTTVYNPGRDDVHLDTGMSIAQLIFQPVPHAVLVETLSDLPASARGEAGFGSSGR